jgi:hypothetical protein
VTWYSMRNASRVLESGTQARSVEEKFNWPERARVLPPAPGVAGRGLQAQGRGGAGLELAAIGINLIAAGFVDTPLSASLLGDQLEARRAHFRATVPIRRVVVSDVLDGVLFLESSPYIIREILPIRRPDRRPLTLSESN